MSIFIIRDKCRGYGVLASYPTQEKAESNLWRYAMRGGELVIEEASPADEVYYEASPADQVENFLFGGVQS